MKFCNTSFSMRPCKALTHLKLNFFLFLKTIVIFVFIYFLTCPHASNNLLIMVIDNGVLVCVFRKRLSNMITVIIKMSKSLDDSHYVYHQKVDYSTKCKMISFVNLSTISDFDYEG